MDIRRKASREFDKAAKKYQESGAPQLIINSIPYIGSGIDNLLKTREYNALREFDDLDSIYNEFSEKIDNNLLGPIRKLEDNVGKKRQILLRV